MKKTLSGLFVGLVMFFLYVPILILIIFSFNSTKSRSVFSGFSFGWYEELFQNDLILESFANTIVVAICATLIATVLGTVAAVGIRNMKKRPRNVIMNITYLPVINPEIISGISLMLLFVYLTSFTGSELGFVTVLIAHVTFNLPYIILNVMPKLRQMNPSMYEAALDLGCNHRKAFFKVVLPEIMPGIISGALMAFTFSLDDFIITYFTSGSSFQTLPVTIYSMTRKRVSPEINALSTILFVLVLLILILYNIKDARQEAAKQKNGK